MEALAGDLAKLAGSSASEIALHENTTSAFKNVLDHLGLSSEIDACIIWDAEYDSMFDILQAECNRRSVTFRPVKADVGTPQSASVYGALFGECARLIKEFGRIIVVTHHVCSLSGSVMDIEQLASAFREIARAEKKEIVLIVDGAQAIGNIAVNLRALEHVPFYLASGHKWLLGVAATGLLFVNEREAQRLLGNARFKEMMQPRRAFSSPGNKTTRRTATIAVDSLISLGVTSKEFASIGMHEIEKHNKALAQSFESALRVTKLSSCFLMQEAESGIVSLRHKDGDQIAEVLASRDIVCTAIPWFDGMSEEPSETILRFCFHYMMKESDVLQAADELTVAYSEVAKASRDRLRQ